MRKMKMKADWKSFQLVMFNLVQNSTKYNNYKGDVIIKLELKKKQDRSSRRLIVQDKSSKKLLSK